MMSKKSPQLRFEGFTDDWEERKLSDIADRFDNLRVPITASDRKPGDTPYYGANGIQDYVEGFTHNGEFILVAEDGANDLKNYPVQYVNGKVWVNNHAHVLQGKKTITDNKFLMNAIKNFNIEPFLVGGGRAKLNADVMMKLNILLPTFVEQEKIGSLFSLLDKTIALHQRKLDLLKEQKKGFLQKMFPKNGAKVPELRFAGFADDWEERKFGEVWKKSSERNLNLEYSPKQVLSVAQMKLNPSNRNEQDDYMKTYNVLHKGDIAFEGNKSKSFAFGRFVLNDLQDGIVSHVFNVYRPICKMDTDFMKVYINNESVMKYLLVKATTKTLMMTTLNTKDIVKQKLNLPSLEEQQKIGSLFKQLDKTIALHQRKLDLLKEQKKGFLQKMFV
ncbi:restriction endonuclease subunit S [Lactococcus lactis]|uniref:restriction endonuclease subunit S n=2 Tax=Lactococcus lactis TaxID=1358 RepID=UPI0025A2084E|nr:restriction endonuclease subunit S [Lactococcus lactis]MCT3113787.1 restriction endonuclease subunit S [Lactococcus lactis]MDM7503137.1 restriction endonuclease subunit S [Lactococcus lactis]